MKVRLHDLRTDYRSRELSESEAPDEPLLLFREWLQAAIDADEPEPNAMTLATVDAEGSPSARTVLLKEIEPDAFVFYTNYRSRKARDLEQNPRAALTSLWVGLHRQVRIEGAAERVPAEQSDAYFASRPRGSQLGAWASPQSEEVADRAALERRLAEMEERFRDGEVTRPPHWGGYRLRPDRIEFWQGRRDRMHDRLVFRRAAAGGWSRSRLAP